MQNSIILESITREELFSELRNIVSQALDKKLQTEAPKDLMTKKEVAEKLRLSLPTVQRLMADGTIKGFRIGRRVLFHADQIDQALKEIHTLKYKRG
jgi:excisionase family DNA binding protein